MPCLRKCLVPFALCLALGANAEDTPGDTTGSAPPAPYPGRATYNPGAFNPAMGLVLDAAARQTRRDKGNFDFRSAELNLSAAVDPFFNLYGVINGTPDGLEVEEAFFMTTSLRHNLTLRGGRMFANFGRFPHWHDHELPFVNRLPSLDRFIGAEAQADGVELLHLFRTPFFLQGTVGAYNKVGGANARLEQADSSGNNDAGGRDWDAFTYLGRLFSYVPMGEDYGLDLGVSEAVTPRENFIGGLHVGNSRTTTRTLTGVDATFRWLPLAENVYRRMTWGSELFINNELQPSGAVDLKRQTALGGYSYLDWRFHPWWSAGPFYDYAQRLEDPDTHDQTFGMGLNLIPSEFSRFHFQFSAVTSNDGSRDDYQAFLQCFLTIGMHVHVFKDR